MNSEGEWDILSLKGDFFSLQLLIQPNFEAKVNLVRADEISYLADPPPQVRRQ